MIKRDASFATQPNANEDLADAAVSWHQVNGSFEVLSRFMDDVWYGPQTGAATTEAIGTRTLNFQKVAAESRSFAKLVIYASLRHPVRMSKTPTFSTMSKRLYALIGYCAFLEEKRLKLGEAPLQITEEYLMARTSEVLHMETLVVLVATLKAIDHFHSRGLLAFRIGLPNSKTGSVNIAKRLWRKVHKKDFDGSGYVPYPDADITRIARNARFFVHEAGPAIVEAFERCNEIRKKGQRDRNGNFGTKIDILCAVAIDRVSWPQKGAEMRNWPPTNYLAVRSFTRVCVGACITLFCFCIGGRRSEVISLEDDSLESVAGGGWTVRLLYRKGEDDLDGREVTISVHDDVAAAIQLLKRIKACILEAKSTVKLSPASNTSQLLITFIATDERKLKKVGMKPDVLSMNGLNAILAQFGKVALPDLKYPLGIHRFRKSVARLVMLTMDGSPLILQQIFGHDHYKTTLKYMFASPYVQDELAESFPELIAGNLKKIYESRDSLRGGAAQLLKEAVGVVSFGRTGIKVESEVGMSEAEFVSLGLEMVEEGFMVLSLLGIGKYCLKPVSALGPCASHANDTFPNLGRCKPTCSRHLILGHAAAEQQATARWLERELSQAGLSPALRKFYLGYLEMLVGVLGESNG